MPDWTYHPLFKPLLFRLSSERSRQLILRALQVQSSFSWGRALFRGFANVVPKPEHEVETMGLRFPSPIGLASGIDIDAEALSVMQYLGFGFMEVGPASAEETPHSYATEPQRVPEFRAIVVSDKAQAPPLDTLVDRVDRSPELERPVGVEVRGPDLLAAVRAAQGAAYIVLPEEAGEDRATLAKLRNATRHPLVLSLGADLSSSELEARTERARKSGIDGLMVVCGARSRLVPKGRLMGPHMLERALRAVRFIRSRTERPIILRGGVNCPEDAFRALDAGATLLSLYEGFVYAGPGLPGRILSALSKRRPIGPPPIPTASPGRGPPWWSWGLIVFTGLVLIGSGLAALALAATVHMLPPDTAFLGMTSEQLCRFYECKVVRFMVHDRVAFGGSIIAVGVVYVWLGLDPLRQGEAWSWWALALSGSIGFSSFLTYLGYGYLDAWHGIATLLLLPWFLLGMGGAIKGLAGSRAPDGAGFLNRAVMFLNGHRGPKSLRVGARAWIFSPAGLGRLLVSFAAFGMIAGGLTIMIVGMTVVFVPQDLAYMGVTLDDLRAISPRLVPLIAHDRAGFGGGLCSCGIGVMASLWCGARPARPLLWWALGITGTVGFSTAIGIHFVVGYTDFIHLLPAYAGMLAFIAGMVLLREPLCKTDHPDSVFPDV